MKLTTAHLLSLAESGLSDTAVRVYITAHTRIAETGCPDLTTPALMTLPGMPRNPKTLARAIQELAEHGLVFGDSGAFVFPVRVSELSAKRAAAGRRGGLAKASKTLASAVANPPTLPEQMPGVLLSDARDPSSPLGLPSPDSPSGSSDLSQADPEDPAESFRSAGAREKPERKRRWRTVPTDWEPNDDHRKLARELSVDFARALATFRDHEFKDPKSDADRAFRNWLRRDATLGKPPGAQQHESQQRSAAYEFFPGAGPPKRRGGQPTLAFSGGQKT